MGKTLLLPPLAAAGGVVCLILRRLQLGTVYEAGQGLPIPGHPLSVVMVLLPVLLALLFFLMIFRAKRVEGLSWPASFRCRCEGTWVASAAAAVLLVISGIFGLYEAAGSLDKPSVVLALLALAGGLGIFFSLWTPKKDQAPPAFPLLLPLIYGCVWLILFYRIFAAEPVISLFAYPLLAIVFSILALYYLAGFAFARPKRGAFLLFSSMAVCFCILSLADGGGIGQQLSFLGLAVYLFCRMFDLERGIAPKAEAPSEE